MDERMEDKERNILKFIGVLMQFCVLSASKKQKTTKKYDKTKEIHKTKQDTTRPTETNEQDNMRDKLIKGLGVSLAKTPLVVLLKNKTDYPQKRVLYDIFFYALCCLIVCLLRLRALRILAMFFFCDVDLSFFLFLLAFVTPLFAFVTTNDNTLNATTPHSDDASVTQTHTVTGTTTVHVDVDGDTDSN